MRWFWVLGWVCAGSAQAQTDLFSLTDADRKAFGAEIRALLLDEPELVTGVLNPVNPAIQETRQHIDDDLTLLAALAPQVLGGADIALFTSADCGECDEAVKELTLISERYGKTFKLHDLDTDPARNLAEALGMDTAPFYVLPQMILRGHMPPIVLQKYLSRD